MNQDLNEDYCFLVNSCDGYADAWSPFFTLFEKFWQPARHIVYLNTESKASSWDGIPIETLHSPTDPRPPWSQRLMDCLERIPFEIVLYLQEDYFLKAPANVGFI